MPNTKDYDFPLLKSDVTLLVQEAVLSALEGNVYDHKKVCDAGCVKCSRCRLACAAFYAVVSHSLTLVLGPDGRTTRKVIDWVANVTTSCIDDLRRLSPVREWSVCRSSTAGWLTCASMLPVWVSASRWATELQVHRDVLHSATQRRRTRVSQVSGCSWDS